MRYRDWVCQNLKMMTYSDDKICFYYIYMNGFMSNSWSNEVNSHEIISMI
jgi:hypothetical protein